MTMNPENPDNLELENQKTAITHIAVFEYRHSGQEKIAGIKRYGHDIEICRTINIEQPLPNFIPEPEDFIDDNFKADLVLCFIKHPDLADYIASICRRKGIPIIASGTKTENALTPFTCCGLGRHSGLGAYGKQFGVPEFEVDLEDGLISAIRIERGASCGATWKAAAKVIGLPVAEALPVIGREVQYFCAADPSAFDPISGKSSLHYAGHVHIKALRKAVDNAGS
ncbi:MAG TPA: hypothetical protein ENK33_06140 [Desulfobacterales bacterium]|nr:hypothetical protein [Desulfobacterales bacterium]